MKRDSVKRSNIPKNEKKDIKKNIKQNDYTDNEKSADKRESDADFSDKNMNVNTEMSPALKSKEMKEI